VAIKETKKNDKNRHPAPQNNIQWGCIGMRWHIPQEDFGIVLDRYERYLRDCDYSENSIASGKKLVSNFLKFAKESHPTIEQADAYREILIDRKLAPGTINLYYFAIRNFYKMHGEEYKHIILACHNAIPHYFSEDEVHRIFDATRNIKHLAMLQTMFYGCLRASELCDLEDRDLDIAKLSVHVRHGKGDKEGIVCITPNCASTLRRYLSIRPTLLIDGKQYLFYTDDGNKWNRKIFHKIFEQIKHRAKITRPGGLHVFGRHTPATLMIAHGADIRVVQTILRHNDIKTTLRYAHVSDTTKRTMYDKFLVI
jgi:integrase/recombinase XerD